MWPATLSPFFKLRQEALWRRTVAEAHEVCAVQATVALLCWEALVAWYSLRGTQLMSAQPTAVKMYVNQYNTSTAHNSTAFGIALPVCYPNNILLWAQLDLPMQHCCYSQMPFLHNSQAGLGCDCPWWVCKNALHEFDGGPQDNVLFVQFCSQQHAWSHAWEARCLSGTCQRHLRSACKHCNILLVCGCRYV